MTKYFALCIVNTYGLYNLGFGLFYYTLFFWFLILLYYLKEYLEKNAVLFYWNNIKKIDK